MEGAPRSSASGEREDTQMTQSSRGEDVCVSGGPRRVEPADRGARVSPEQVDAAFEWRRFLTGATLGLLVFETVTGLTIYLLPFSRFNQFAVLWHTVVGIVMAVPVGWYLGQHWWRRFRGNLNHYQLLGYLTAIAVLVLFVSGVVLTWQALFGTRISRAWDLIHIVVGFVLIAVLAAHLITLVWRRVGNETARRLIRRAHWSSLVQTAVWGGGLTGLCWLTSVGYSPVEYNDTFPSDYSFRYGADRPFAPSLARKDMSDIEDRLRAGVLAALDEDQGRFFLANFRADPTKHEGLVSVAVELCRGMSLNETARGRVDNAIRRANSEYRQHGAIDARRLAGSTKCGTSGCHSEILDEWLPSAHRYASMDFVFQKVQADLAEQKAPEATRYCAGCHDPIALFSGAKNVGNVTLSAEGADEGVSCLVCHSTVQTDVRGNADYTIRPPEPYIFEAREGKLAKLVSDFLIRAYPREHIASYSRPLYKTAESCGACHKQFIDEELNDVGWVQGQNQYDNWRKSRWHHEGDVEKTIACRDCHMPLQQSDDPAAGDSQDPNRSPDDGKHRSHRFLAANQFVPRHHKLEGAEKQCELTVKWLRGEVDVPEIAEHWTTGPVIRLALSTPERVRPGESVRIQTILTNNKTGHDFPTGPLDMIESWVEVTVTDEHGNIVFASARPDERGYLVNPQIVFKAELINRLGELIGRHELWTLVGARFKRALFPGFTDTTDFVFECPAMATGGKTGSRRAGSLVDDRASLTPEQSQSFALASDFSGRELRVTAIVKYCKFSAPFLDRLFGEDAGLRSDITEISRAEAVIPVVHEDLASVQ